MASADNDNSPKGSAPAPEATGAKCPICGKPALRAVRPFCSARCADIDLGRWMAGSYLILGGQSDADEDGDDAALAEAGRKRPEGDQEPDA